MFRIPIIPSLLFLLAAVCISPAMAQDTADSQPAELTPACPVPTVGAGAEPVLEKVRDRYKGKSFCMDFSQYATMKGMGITDTGTGSACFKYPDRMHWHYKEPEEQHVVSDGDSLWIYRPEDRQVMVGEAAGFFGGGEGASFLSDPTVLVERFSVKLGEQDLLSQWDAGEGVVLELAPRNPTREFAMLFLVIDPETGDIEQSVSYNQFGDETRIVFTDPDFREDIPDSEFVFVPPGTADVIRMEDR
ncbi:MAG: LolA family protein [Desulfatibacillaceae bacterium]